VGEYRVRQNEEVGREWVCVYIKGDTEEWSYDNTP
jgi:hypothetical protein